MAKGQTSEIRRSDPIHNSKLITQNSVAAPATIWGVGLAGLGAGLLLAGLLAARPVEQLADPWDPWRLVVYALLILAPAGLGWAASQALRLGLFWVFGTAAWAAFGYMLIFVPPPPPGATPAAPLLIAGFLALLFAAFVAALTPPLYALGWAIFTQRMRRHDLRRALRQAALLALGVVACLGMGLFSLFNGLNALLLFVVLALAEFFFLSRT